jgi:cytochrome c oxidase subunit III
MTTTVLSDQLPVAEQFDDWQQQYETRLLGMWVFLVTEVMFFGGLFTAYMIYRNSAPHTFAVASNHLSLWLGGINTGVLLTSSFSMALAVYSAHHQNARNLVLFLIATIVLGVAFMGIKAYEYYQKYRDELMPVAGLEFKAEQLVEQNEPGLEQVEAITPGTGSHPSIESVAGAGTPGFDRGKAQIFYCLYFAMTGLHFLHMLIGVVFLLLFLRLAAKGTFTHGNFVPVEILGLYWHFVDVIWIFLFPLLYLIDRSHQ